MTFAKSVLEASPNEGEWNKNKFSPSSRRVHAQKIHRVEGNTENVENLLVQDTSKIAVLHGSDTAVTLDFGFNTCGLIQIEFDNDNDDGKHIELSFSESKQFIDKTTSDRSMDFLMEDLTLKVLCKGTYEMPWVSQRGAFRYLTLWTHDESRSISIKSISTYMTCMPSLGDDLSNYSGYFHSSDQFANSLWYAGAYTIQLATIPVDSGRRHSVIMPRTGWFNDALAGLKDASEILTDGARRDRSVWSGDRSVSLLTEAVCFDGVGGQAATDWLLTHQKESGEFPYACKPIDMYGSDTYHLWSLVNVYDSFKLTGDDTTASSHWQSYKKGLEYSRNKVSELGLIKVTNVLDWGRDVLQNHAASCNMIYYHTLIGAVELATRFGDEKAASEYASQAKELKSRINEVLWDEQHGMFRDNELSSVLSQDANCFAVWFDVTSEERKESISENLARRWTKFGAPAVESPGMISPFISSCELFCHSLAGHPERALELFRTMWGYIWNSPYAVQSSLIEGYFQDGSCKYPFTLYDPAYISHAHPWATGPTVLLTNHIVGLTFEHDHSQWNFFPAGIFADNAIKWAQTGFTSKTKGFISAGYKFERHLKSLELAVKSPKETEGKIGIPYNSDYAVSTVTVNGEILSTDELEIQEKYYVVSVKESVTVVVSYC
ncbi:BA75_03308T0 [Komagataella pastoris]|uniref:BA75_03308T0 n=1 Tax=Komagataella pastoris TaxID=4922 RepID=A0A1B2JAB1_PICPA|nr:BA75_03308T0 [Komagataella pastoris]